VQHFVIREIIALYSFDGTNLTAVEGNGQAQQGTQLTDEVAVLFTG
jgi:hypothetical protein